MPGTKKGFTLVESIVTLAIFTILLLVVYQSSATIIKSVRIYRESTTVASLADQYLEIARNLPYSQIGTLSGNPHGYLPDLPNAATTTINGTNYKAYYVISYVDDPSDGTATTTDTAADDYKQVKLYIKNLSTNVTTSFFTNITSKGLEGMSSGGALSIKVFNAVGQPVPNATIQITNASTSYPINLTRTTDANGNWIEVGLPVSSNSYHIVATKAGYSSDQTYPISVSNPSPTKPDATVANGQVTQVSFSIDQTSSLTFNTLGQTCLPLSGIGLAVQGAKLIGTPNVYKFTNSYTSNGSGQVALSPIEWDNYTPTLTSSSYMIYGSSPIQQISMLPNTSQTFTLELGPKTTNSLLVIVKDASTGNPIEGASVTLATTTKITAGSIWSQQNWTGGQGQGDFSDTTKYYQSTGISTTDLPYAVRLSNSNGSTTVSSGWLISSSFDTGTASSTYSTLSWQPTSQDPAATLKFQIATNNDDITWNFLGPDGTASTYYTVPGTSINAVHNNNRYVRYKAYLSTTNNSKNPTLTSVNLNYVSGCFAPGQAMYAGLSAGSNYQATISMTGYQTQTISNINISGYNVLQVSLASQ